MMMTNSDEAGLPPQAPPADYAAYSASEAPPLVQDYGPKPWTHPHPWEALPPGHAEAWGPGMPFQASAYQQVSVHPWAPSPHQGHVHFTVRGTKGPNHLLHLVLTAATCGLWSPIWIIDALRGQRPA